MVTGPLRILIVGGGPVGLTAAAALDRAGIDFLLLERRSEVVEKIGSSLVLTPFGMPALVSLGLEDQIQRYSTALGRINRVDHSGNDLGVSDMFVRLQEVTGLGARVIGRHELTEMLYNSISVQGREKILVNKSLTNISTHPEGVTAECVDGTTYSGTVLLGADGANSKVRGLMRKIALAAGSTEVNDETPFTTTFRSLWIRFPRPADIAPGYVCESHGKSATTQLFTDTDTGVTGVYERVTKTPGSIRYTKDDEKALVDRWGHLPVATSPHKTLRELYDTRIDSGLVSLEEGFVRHWSHGGRIVLAGDAAHKFTPSTGAGCNAGIVDVAALVKEVYSTVQSSKIESAPSAAELADAFTRYQENRQQQIESECAGSGMVTKLATWETTTLRLIDQYVLSQRFVQKLFESRIAKGGAVKRPTFDFIPVQVKMDATPSQAIKA